MPFAAGVFNITVILFYFILFFLFFLSFRLIIVRLARWILLPFPFHCVREYNNYNKLLSM